MSDSLQPHEPQHARSLCSSPTPRVYPNPCPSSWWCHPTISSSVVPFSSCPQSFSIPTWDWSYVIFELSDCIGLHFPRLLGDFVRWSLIWSVLLSLLWDGEGSNCLFSEAWFCHLVTNAFSCCSVCERPCSEFNLCQLTASLRISQ